MRLIRKHDKSIFAGELQLTEETIELLRKGCRFELSLDFLDEDGVLEPLYASLISIPVSPKPHTEQLETMGEKETIGVLVVDEKDSRTWLCKECGREKDIGGWWKCCPDHTAGNPPSDVLCTACMRKKHPDKQVIVGPDYI